MEYQNHSKLHYGNEGPRIPAINPGIPGGSTVTTEPAWLPVSLPEAREVLDEDTREIPADEGNMMNVGGRRGLFQIHGIYKPWICLHPFSSVRGAFVRVVFNTRHSKTALELIIELQSFCVLKTLMWKKNSKINK